MKNKHVINSKKTIKNSFGYELWLEGNMLTSDSGFEDEDEAEEEARLEAQSRLDEWKSEGHAYDDYTVDDFGIEITEEDDEEITNSKQGKGKMKKQIIKNGYFYGIEPLEFVSHGEWSDPEVIYKGESINYWDLEDACWNDYKDETGSDDEAGFETWIKENPDVAIGNADNFVYANAEYRDDGETEVVNSKQMKKTNYMLISMLDKGFADNVDFLENGYDILANKNEINVRLDGRGGALIRNGKKLTEVKSARLDDILAKFILKSAYGHKGSFFKKEEIKNGVMLTDPRGKKWVINSTPKIALDYVNMFDVEDCDEALVGLPVLNAYSPRTIKEVQTIDEEVEMIQLKSSLDPSDYAFMPKADMIENVGQTVVGNHLCSSADKFAVQSFDEKLNGLFCSKEVKHDNTIVNSLRTHNAMAERTSSAIESAHKQKELKNYFNKKYPEGLSREALTNALAFEAPAIFNACGIEEKLAYNDTFNKMVKRADAVTFRLDNSRNMFVQLDKAGIFSARFRAIPNVEGIKNALAREGYAVQDIESGMTVTLAEEITPSIIANCANFKPVTEERVMKGSTVEMLKGNSVTNALKAYGINDETKVFNELSRVVVCMEKKGIDNAFESPKTPSRKRVIKNNYYDGNPQTVGWLIDELKNSGCENVTSLWYTEFSNISVKEEGDSVILVCTKSANRESTHKTNNLISMLEQLDPYEFVTMRLDFGGRHTTSNEIEVEVDGSFCWLIAK